MGNVGTQRGHWQGFALNFAAGHARGDYLCFLDDDQWTDPDHLGRAAGVIVGSAEPIDLLLANQRAYRDNVPVPGVIWIEDLKDVCSTSPTLPALARYPHGIAGLSGALPPEHDHLSRASFLALSGIGESQRFETDRDFFLRAIDRARLIKFLPWVVSRHNLPDPDAKANMTTVESELSKQLSRLRVFDKVVPFSVRPEV